MRSKTRVSFAFFRRCSWGSVCCSGGSRAMWASTVGSRCTSWSETSSVLCGSCGDGRATCSRFGTPVSQSSSISSSPHGSGQPGQKRRTVSDSTCPGGSPVGEPPRLRDDNLAVPHVGDDSEGLDRYLQPSQGLAPTFKRLLNHRADADNRGPSGLREPGQPEDGLPGGQEVVHDEHAVARLEIFRRDNQLDHLPACVRRSDG